MSHFVYFLKNTYSIFFLPFISVYPYLAMYSESFSKLAQSFVHVLPSLPFSADEHIYVLKHLLWESFVDPPQMPTKLAIL